MTDFWTTDTFETAMGGVILLFVIAMIWRIGLWRFLGEMLAHFAAHVIFVIVIVLLAVLFMTDLGQALGGLDTWGMVVLGAPVILIVAAIAMVLGARRKGQDRDASGPGEDNG